MTTDNNSDLERDDDENDYPKSEPHPALSRTLTCPKCLAQADFIEQCNPEKSAYACSDDKCGMLFYAIVTE